MLEIKRKKSIETIIQTHMDINRQTEVDFFY